MLFLWTYFLSYVQYNVSLFINIETKMRIKLCLLFSFFFSVSLAIAQIPDNRESSYRIPENLIPHEDYVPGKLIFKLKANANPHDTRMQNLLTHFGISAPKAYFPQAKKPRQTKDIFGRPYTDLSSVFFIEFPESLSIYSLSEALNQLDLCEYIQPQFIYSSHRENAIMFTPNDPQVNLQWHLQKINAYQAWDIFQGDTNIVIAIADGGQNWSNPDLQNYYVNYNDPVDGLDNDGDGWIDNISGWNTGDNNYDVTAYCGSCIHGTAVSGVAAAGTNNNAGVAGVGFKTKFMPIKIANSANQWVGGEASIFYAAEQQVKIINCSWGSTFFNPVLLDVVKYATINKGCMVVASAGNGSPTTQTPYFPAAYENVVAVSGTDTSDLKLGNMLSGSSFYKEVDLTAPAQNIYTTLGASYANVGNGTSYSAPMVSAAAALLHGMNPGLHMLQIEAILKQTAFDNRNLPGNLAYAGKIGSGRLDLNAALSNSVYGPYFLFQKRKYSSSSNNAFLPGDTVFLNGNFLNLLDASSASAYGVLRSNSPYVQLVDSLFTMGIVQGMDSTNNLLNPYSFLINASCPENQEIELEWVWYDGSYSQRQFFSLIVHPNYIDVEINKLHTSIGFKGRIGFMDENDEIGLGIKSEDGFQHMLAGSFLIAENASRVSDATFSSAVVPFDADFNTLQATEQLPSPANQFIARGKFDDSAAGAQALGVEITQNIEALNEVNKDQFVLIEYEIENTQTDSLQSVYAGIQAYWNLLNTQYYDYSNVAAYDTLRRMGYGYNPSGNSKFAGIRLLSGGPATHYAFNFNGAGGSINMQDGFTSAEKWSGLSSVNIRNQSNPGTSLSMVGSGPFAIQPGAKIKLAFALVIGNSKNELQENADSAMSYYLNKWNMWTGAVSTNWHLGGNWSKGIVPDSSHRVIINFNASHQPQINFFAACKDLHVDSGAILQIMDNAALRIGEQCENYGSIYIWENGQFLQAEKSNYNGNGIFKTRKTAATEMEYFGGLSRQIAPLSDFYNGISGGINANIWASSDSLPILPSACYSSIPASGSPLTHIAVFQNTQALQCVSEGYRIRLNGQVLPGYGMSIRMQAGDSLIQIGKPFNQQLNRTFNQTTTNARFGHFAANPYPSRVDWTHFIQQNSHISGGAAYVQSGKNLQLIQAYNNPYLPSAAGFWFGADSNQTQVDLLYENAQRKSGMAYDTAQLRPFHALYRLQVESPSLYSNEIMLIDDKASDFQTEYALDLAHIHPGFSYPYWAIKNPHDQKLYASNSIPLIQGGDIFPLHIKSDESGVFTFRGKKSGLGNDSLWALFYDAVDSTFTFMEDDSAISIHLNQPQEDLRFSLVFAHKARFQFEAAMCKESAHQMQITNPQNIPISWYLLSTQNGDTLYSGQSQSAHDTIWGIASGDYILYYGAGKISDSASVQLSVLFPVLADFDAASSAGLFQPINFQNQSTGADTYQWDFGDGNQSALPDPQHTYNSGGNFVVRLISSNPYCSDTIEKNIYIWGQDAEETGFDSIKCWATGQNLYIQTSIELSDAHIRLYAHNGQLIRLYQKEHLSEGLHSFHLPIVAAGLYLIEVSTKEQTFNKKLYIDFGK